ncbi:UvrD-helicase domain-containing protein [Pseudomonas putida]|nr:UvrD-helicase domain-containing protein [Pseudomonas putida]MBF8710870.1 UvrD-helicase domain-containing protein [Pseudomonas putida]
MVGGQFELNVDGRVVAIRPGEGDQVSASRGMFWRRLTYPGGSLGGLLNHQVSGLNEAIADVVLAQEREITAKRLQDEKNRKLEEAARERERVERYLNVYTQIRGWVLQVGQRLLDSQQERRWVTHEQQVALWSARPQITVQDHELDALFSDQSLAEAMGVKFEDTQRVVRFWRADLHKYWQNVNETFTKRELVDENALLSKVEKLPLNEEQARAVICFDNRVLSLASAGSGKTSTMVSKAIYAIHRQFFRPQEIVMLAFNKEAAKELAERAAQAFARVGMDNVTVRAKTFHRLGLAIIGYATKKKPRVPDWVVKEKLAIKKLEVLVDVLKDSSAEFRNQWDLFRIVFARDLPAFKSMKAPTKVGSKAGRFSPILGEPVKSLEECMICNWLFYNGVDYRYEYRYEHDTATEAHSQYHPDFYYPAIGLYHEHFALDERGQPPAHFEGYLEGVQWKRALHSKHGTELIETASFQIRQNSWVEHLTFELTSRGIKLDPNPDRPTPDGRKPPLSEKKLICLIRTFIAHVKSNCLTKEELLKRVEGLSSEAFKYRYRMFLDIVWPVMGAWNQALEDAEGIDFEDMLVQAAEHVESGRCVPKFKLVMADEFQDASVARARLCRALVNQPGRHFFAVGDDWQSINRFAGADVSVMTDFKQFFGSGQLLKLEETFRCPQALCDISSRFVGKNPVQLQKTVVSKTPAVGPALRAIMVSDVKSVHHGIVTFLEQLVAGLIDGSVPKAKGRLIKVYVLGRYNDEESYVPQDWKARFGQFVELSFQSIHRSKGAEADYVILPAMVTMQRGRSFPSTMTDDPVLGLVMPGGDSYPFAEERRLFYVALTRARRTVVMYTVRERVSVFLKELVQDGMLQVEDVHGAPVRLNPCPQCTIGDVILQNGKYGEYFRCNNFPACDFKAPKKKPVKKSKYSGKRYFRRPVRTSA